MALLLNVNQFIAKLRKTIDVYLLKGGVIDGFISDSEQKFFKDLSNEVHQNGISVAWVLFLE